MADCGTSMHLIMETLRTSETSVYFTLLITHLFHAIWSELLKRRLLKNINYKGECILSYKLRLLLDSFLLPT
jgi:hypothetical protein